MILIGYDFILYFYRHRPLELMAVRYRIPKTRPEWYTRFFRTVEGTEEKRHKFSECGFEGMAVPYALINIILHFAAAKYHDCR